MVVPLAIELFADKVRKAQLSVPGINERDYLIFMAATAFTE